VKIWAKRKNGAKAFLVVRPRRHHTVLAAFCARARDACAPAALRPTLTTLSDADGNGIY